MIRSVDDILINAAEFLLMLKGVQDVWPSSQKIKTPADLKNFSFCFTYKNNTIEKITLIEVEE